MEAMAGIKTKEVLSLESVNKVRKSQHSISREEDQSRMIEGSMGHIDGLISPVLLGLPPCQRGKVRYQQPAAI